MSNTSDSMLPSELYYEQCAKVAKIQHEYDALAAELALARHELAESKAQVAQLQTEPHVNDKMLQSDSKSDGKTPVAIAPSEHGYGADSNRGIDFSSASPINTNKHHTPSEPHTPATEGAERQRSDGRTDAGPSGSTSESPATDHAVQMCEAEGQVGMSAMVHTIAAPPAAWLDTRYEDRETVRALGAVWDPDKKQNYVPPGIELAPFQPWLPAGRTYLRCPYADKEDAKGLGARWDPDKSKWYVPGFLDCDPFAKWIG